MSNPEFKWKHFAAEVILWSVRWYGSRLKGYRLLADVVRGVKSTDGMREIEDLEQSVA